MQKQKWTPLIIIMVIILIASNQGVKKEAGPGGATITRTISPASTAPSGEFTIKYTISSAAGNYGGILTEVIPTGFTINPTSFINNMDVFSKKITGQLIEMPFAGSANGQYIEYKLTAGSTSGTLSQGKVDWGSGAGTDVLPSQTLTVGVTCTPDCSCASNTCSGQTCSNGCSGTCSGTKVCVKPALTWTVANSNIQQGEKFTFKYTISSATGSYGGILSTTLPSGFTADALSFTNNMDVFSKKITGQLIEMPFAGSINSQYIEYKVAPPLTGTTFNVSGGQVEWGSNLGTDIIPSKTLTIGGSGCTSSAQCSAFDSACKTGVCASGNCSAQNKADGTSCTGGTCQAGDCKSSQTCAQLSGTQCASGQQCTGGVMTSTSDIALCCVGGTCQNTPTADTSCEKNLNCEFWEQCDEAKTSCEMGTWVYLVGAFMGIILLMNSLK